MIDFMSHVLDFLGEIMGFVLIEGITIKTIFMYNLLLVALWTAFTRR